MPKVRNFVLLAVCLAFVWAFTASTVALAGNSFTTTQDNESEELTYLREVITPAINAGTLSEEQAIWYKNFAARYHVEDPNGNFRRDDEGNDGGDFGWFWKDSDEEGVDFEWIDITEEVDPFDGVSDDWNSGFQDLGWTFTFYGEDYDQININSNGWISFVEDEYIYSLFDTRIPNQNVPNGLICPFTTDLDFTDVNEEDNPGIFFWTDPDNEIAIVTWQAIPEWDAEGGFDPNPQTFQVILTQQGVVPFIKFQYADEEVIHDSDINIGIESPDGGMGMSIYFGLAGDGEDDHYTNGEAIVVTTLFPEDEPTFANNPAEFDFGAVTINQEATFDASFFNIGEGDLTITDATLNDENEVFSWDVDLGGEDLVLGTLESMGYSLTFAPAEEADYEASIVVSHNGVNAEEGTTTIMIYGSGADMAVIAWDPESIETEIESFASEEHEITISNEGGLDLNWTATVNILSEPGDDERGIARRDDRGDEIEDKVVDLTDGVNSYKGLSWDYDNDYLFSSSYTSNTARIYDPEANEELSNLAGVNSCMDNAYLEGIYYAQQYANSTCNMLVLNEDGELERLGTFAWNGSMYGIAADRENDWLIVENQTQNYRVEFWTLDEDREPGEMLGAVDNWRDYTGGNTGYNLEWVPAHRDIGALWTHYTTTCYQINIDEEEWEAVDIEEDGYGSFQVQSTYYYEGMAHDGEDLWVTGYGYAEAIAYDDGIAELYWLAFSPEEGTIAGGENEVLTITLQPGNGPEGEYQGDIIISSNDAQNGEITIGVTMSVVGKPAIRISWPKEYGYVDIYDEDYDVDADGTPLIDFNAMFDPNLFNGYDMNFPIKVENLGPVPLTIGSVDFEGDGVFSVDEDAVEIAAFENYTMTVILNADATDDYVGLMTINSDATENAFWSDPAWEIEMTGSTLNPPIIGVDPYEIFEELEIAEGNTSEFELTITNDGDAPLVFKVDHEIISEPERDANVRSVRRAGSQSAIDIRRDDRGDLIDGKVIDLDEGINMYKALAWDYDNGYMMVGSYSANNSIAAYDVEANERLSVVGGMTYTMDIAYLDGVTYGCYNGGSQLHRAAWDEDGELESLGADNYNGGLYGIAADYENNWLLIENSQANYDIEVYTMTDEHELDEKIATISGNSWRPYVGNQYSYNLEWVPAHRDVGQLWIHYQSTMYQIKIDEDEWEAVDMEEDLGSFQVQSTYYYEGAAHDGYDLWVTGYGYSQAKAYDDGISEAYWFNYDLKDGEIEVGGDPIVMNILLDAAGLHEGTYEAELYFISNDPASPTYTVPITLETIGSPQLDAEWSRGYGYEGEYDEQGGEANGVVDFNAAWDPNLFTGAEYNVTVTFLNEGSRYADVAFVGGGESGYFSCDPAEFTVYAENEFDVNILFNADFDDPGDFVETLIFEWDGEDDFEVNVTASATMPPVMRVEPDAIEAYDLVTGEVRTEEIGVYNDGSSDLYFAAEIFIPEEEEGGMARRDDRGDEIEDKVVDLADGVNSYKGLSWDYDNDYLFSSSYTSNTARIYDPEANEELSNLAGVNSCMDNAYLEGIYYAQQYANATCNMLVLNEDGELERLGTFAWNGSMYGIAADRENDWLLVENSNQNYRIEVWTLNGDREPDEMLGAIDGNSWRAYTNGSTAYNLEWVPGHRDIGALWIHYQTNCYQIAVDEDEWECVDIEDGYGSFQVQSTYYYEGMAHDGQDLWVTGYGYATAIAYDDGIAEVYWISISPEEGIVEPDDMGTIDVILDARGISGDFYGEVWITSNDRAETGSATVPVSISITPVPDLVVDWDFYDDEMEVNVIDWTQYYGGDIFVGADYEVVVTLINDGTADLTVTGVMSDEEEAVFVSNFGQDDVVLEPDEEMEVTLTFSPPDNGEYGTEENPINMVFYSDDPLEEEKMIPVYSHAFYPPEIEIDTDEIADDLFTGDIVDYEVEISNVGDATLNWEAEAEVIEEGGRDAELRGVRRAGPKRAYNIRRDDRGDVIEGKEVDLEEGMNMYKALAWDYDNGYLMVGSYSANNSIAAYDVEANERLSVVGGMTYTMDIAYLNGVTYGCYNGGSQLHRAAWNEDGELESLGADQYNGGLYGIAADWENNWLLIENSSANYDIEVYTMTDDHTLDEKIATISGNSWRPYVGNSYSYNLEWVPDHRDIGQLWIHYTTTMYQLLIDEENWEAVDMEEDLGSFQVQSTYYYEGAAHDGEDLWVTGYGYSQAIAYDDGIAEVRWLSFTPEEGSLEGGDAEIVTITINTNGLYTGDYRAIVHFYSNDVANPDVELFIEITVEGVGRIMVEEGGPEEDNMPVDFGITYIGYPQIRTITVSNVGTDDLIIYDFLPAGDNNGEFDVSEDVIDALPILLYAADDGENELDIEVFFDPEEEGDYELQIEAYSTDPGWDDDNPYPVTMVATALDPPVIDIEDNYIQLDLRVGEQDEIELAVENVGGSELIYEVEIVIIDRDRDADVRSVRRAGQPVVALEDNAGPQRRVDFRRDDRGDVVEGKEVDLSDGANTYKSVAWDYDKGLLWTSSYSSNTVRLYDPDENELLGSIAGMNSGMGCAYMNGVLFVSYYGNSTINRVVIGDDGGLESIGGIQGPGSCYGLTVDHENSWLLFENANNNYSIHVFEVDGDNELGDEIGVIDGNDWRARINGNTAYNLEWVPGHRDQGQLWIHYTNTMYQIKVDEDTWETEDIDDEFGSFQVHATQLYEDGGHDGEDLWLASYSNAVAIAYDDGIAETKWLIVDPMEGTIDANDGDSVFLLFDANGLYDGDYLATLIFHSNDPETPQVEVDIALTVEGFALWGTNLEEESDQWNDGQLPMPFAEEANLDFPPSYVDDDAIGSDTYVTLQLVNAGSADLIVEEEDIEIDGDFYISGDAAGGFAVLAYDTYDLMVAFNASQLGERDGTLMLYSNAENEEIVDAGDPVEWTLTGIGQEVPEIWTDPEGGETITVNAGLGAEQLERVITIGNREGEWRRDLYFEIEIEEIEMEEEGGMARRDDRGDEIEDKVLDLEEGINMYKALAWDYDNEYMMVGSYSANNSIAAYDVEANERLSVVGGMTYTMDIAYLEGVTYGCYNGGTQLHRAAWDEDGELESLGALNFNGSLYGIASDYENNWLIIENSSQNYRLEVWTMTDDHELDEMIGAVDGNSWRPYVNNQYSYNLEWVPDHRDVGQLWIHYTTTMYQLKIDEDEWEAVDMEDDELGPFQVQSTYYYEGAAHDGEDLWVTGYGYSQAIAYDDGIAELHWIFPDIDEGYVEPDGSAEVTLTLDTEGLMSFVTVEANVYIFWNDALEGDAPDSPVVIHVELTPGARLQHFDEPFKSDNIHTLNVNGMTLNDGDQLPTGWEIGVMNAGDELAGAVVWQEGGVALNAHGGFGGFSAGDDFFFAIWDPESDREYPANPTWDEGNAYDYFVSDEVSDLTLNGIEVWDQTLTFDNTWSLVSMHIDLIDMYDPERDDGPDMDDVIAIPIDDPADEDDVLENYIEVIKDVDGNFNLPQAGFGGIDYWDYAAGYWIKVSERGISATWEGVPVGADHAVLIRDGWNILPYYPDYELPATGGSDYYVIADLIENFDVIIAKDDEGRFIVPAWDFSTFTSNTPWKPGKGYMLNIDLGGQEAYGFTYPAPYEADGVAADVSRDRSSHWTAPVSTGENMSLLVKSVSGVEISADDEIAAYNRVTGEVVGISKYNNGMMGIPVWGDVKYDGSREIPSSNFDIVLRYWDKDNEQEMTLKPTTFYKGSDLRYTANDVVIMDAEIESFVPDLFDLSNNYPNPFNSITRFNYDVPEDAALNISVFDVSGRLVETLISGEQKAGRHTMAWDATDVASGVYVVQMTAPSFTKVRKVMLVK
ncbi:T9SS type A sorting domain-containing protein [Calditrichota bacterium]